MRQFRREHSPPAILAIGHDRYTTDGSGKYAQPFLVYDGCNQVVPDSFDTITFTYQGDDYCVVAHNGNINNNKTTWRSKLINPPPQDASDSLYASIQLYEGEGEWPERIKNTANN